MDRSRLAVAFARSTVFVLCAWPVARAAAEAPPPALDPRAPILCMYDERGLPVRVQCDAPSHPGQCLVASACVPGTGGAGTCQWLERLRGCDQPADAEATLAQLVGDRTRVSARADVIDGWWRDELGRVFQVEFDLNRRFWLGARWIATAHEGEVAALDGAGFDSGFRVDVLHDDLATRTRFRFLESDVTLAPLTLYARLLAVDSSSDGDEPFLRVTTFVGEPRRHDVYLTAGYWTELLAVEHAPRGSVDDTFVRFTGAGITWDLWHDADMTSFVRLRGGAALDEALRDGHDAALAVTAVAAFEAELGFDRGGFHRLTLSSVYEAPWFDDPLTAGDDLERHTRWSNEIAYELVLVAIDDQPITLVAGVQGGFRDDLGDPAHNGWEVSASAGLRVSLWAPAPDHEARERAEARRADKARR